MHHLNDNLFYPGLGEVLSGVACSLSSHKFFVANFNVRQTTQAHPYTKPM